MLEVIESVIKSMLELAAERGAHRFAVGSSRGRSGWARSRRQRRRRRGGDDGGGAIRDPLTDSSISGAEDTTTTKHKQRQPHVRTPSLIRLTRQLNQPAKSAHTKTYKSNQQPYRSRGVPVFEPVSPRRCLCRRIQAEESASRHRRSRGRPLAVLKLNENGLVSVL